MISGSRVMCVTTPEWMVSSALCGLPHDREPAVFTSNRASAQQCRWVTAASILALQRGGFNIRLGPGSARVRRKRRPDNLNQEDEVKRSRIHCGNTEMRHSLLISRKRCVRDVCPGSEVKFRGDRVDRGWICRSDSRSSAPAPRLEKYF